MGGRVTDPSERPTLPSVLVRSPRPAPVRSAGRACVSPSAPPRGRAVGSQGPTGRAEQADPGAEVRRRPDHRDAVGPELADRLDEARALDGINADLVAVRKSIDQMVVKIEAVKKQYFSLVARLQLLDNQLANLVLQESHKRSQLGQRKAQLADADPIRLRHRPDDRSSRPSSPAARSPTSSPRSATSTTSPSRTRSWPSRSSMTRRHSPTIHATVESTRGPDREPAGRDRRSRRPSSTPSSSSSRRPRRASRSSSGRRPRRWRIQKSAYAQLVKNKTDLARAIATTARAQRAPRRKDRRPRQAAVPARQHPVRSTTARSSGRWPAT